MNLELWCDVSFYQNGGDAARLKPIDFGKMRRAGVDGVCVRKSTGYYRDVAFDMNWDGANFAGLKRTLYTVPFIGYDTAKQLTAMTTVVRNGIVTPFLPKLDRPMWLDCERAHQKGRQQATNEVMWYLLKLTEWYGANPHVYTNRYLFEQYFSDKPGWIDGWGIVVANYGAGIPAMPKGWRFRTDGAVVPAMEAWKGWQYSADGNGQGSALGCWSSAVDLSWQKVLE